MPVQLASAAAAPSSAPSSTGSSSALKNLITHLNTNSSTFSARALPDLIASFREQSFSNGLSPANVHKAVLVTIKLSVVSPKSAILVIASTLPRQDVRPDSVLHLLGGFGSMSLPLRLASLNWLSLVYDCLESLDLLSSLYSVIFHCLDYETLRPPACYVLFRLTRREHVRKFRLAKLQRLCQQSMNNAWLVGLLKLFDAYLEGPDAIPSSRARLKFKLPSSQLRHRLELLQSMHACDSRRRSLPFALDMQTSKRRATGDRTALELLPLHALEPIACRGPLAQPTIGIHQVQTMPELAEVLSVLALPNQLSSVLSSRMLHHVLATRPRDGDAERVRHYLSHYHRSLLDQPGRLRQRRLGHLLRLLQQLTRVFAELIYEVESLLLAMLPTWDGVEYREDILAMLSYLPPRDFVELDQQVFQPLYRVFVSSAAVVQAEHISFFGSMLQRWLCAAQMPHCAVFSESERARFEPDELQALVTAVVEHVDRIASVVLISNGDPAPVHHAIVSFYDDVCKFPSTYSLPHAFLPSHTIVYRSIMSRSPLVCSRLCGILVQCWKVISTLKKSRDVDSVLHNQIRRFNSFISDACNMLWRQRPLLANDTDSARSESGLFSDCHVSVTSVAGIDEAFSIFCSPAFASFKENFLTAHALPLVPQSFASLETKVAYLDHLAEAGLNGLKEFLFTFMRRLRSSA